MVYVRLFFFLFDPRVFQTNSCLISKKRSWLTFNEHPEKVSQVEVVQEDDNNTRPLVGLSTIQLEKTFSIF